LLWAEFAHGYVWAVLLLTLGYGALGFIDDYIKLSRANFAACPGAASSSAGGAGIAVSVWIAWLTRAPLGTGLALPVFKES